MPEPTPAPVHACPPRGSGIMPCCRRSPVEVPGERKTTQPDMVTCGRGVGPTPAGTVDNPDGPREAYAAAIDEGFRTADEIEDANLGECLTGAILALRDSEVQQLRAELQRLREESPWLRATAEDLADAKAAIARVRAAMARTLLQGPNAIEVVRLSDLHAALDQPQEQP
jgi:hypothetical protein